MSEVITAGIIRKLRYTPLQDVLRGQLNGRLDAMAKVAASALPLQAKALVQRVVRRTRLWPGEKVDVANELIGHFADGLQTGASVQELIDQFGNERLAAKLIRCAKQRGRPLAWHILRRVGWIALVLLSIYAYMALRYILARPSPKMDYLAALNQPRLAVPQQDRS